VGGEGGTQRNYPYVSEVSGELNDIHIVYNPGEYGQHVPLHFLSIWGPQQRTLCFSSYPCHSPYSFVSTVVGFSRGHGHPRPHRCSHIAALSQERSTRGGGQSFSRRHSAVEEDSVTEEQPGIIETTDRLDVVCPERTVLLVLGRTRMGCGHGNVAEHVGSNRRVTGLEKRRSYSKDG